MDAGLRLRLALLLRQRTTATKVTTTRGDRDNNRDRRNRIRHPSHSHCHQITGITAQPQFLSPSHSPSHSYGRRITIPQSCPYPASCLAGRAAATGKQKGPNVMFDPLCQLCQRCADAAATLYQRRISEARRIRQTSSRIRPGHNDSRGLRGLLRLPVAPDSRLQPARSKRQPEHRPQPRHRHQHHQPHHQPHRHRYPYRPQHPQTARLRT
ncbi:hypothetical protein G1C98_1591 [Bifidobacterium sp. DSM 109960]|uniref:Uncharacterized protein n=1 Tax=Bifidobacterium erythrocebi TaxID=2675325 RepID=A0A7Y0HU56_9BIFI|nr:hypothetical protein [Bifidobacterium sp. DSM 109960]